MPATPKEQSIKRHHIGIPRIAPKISAYGTTRTQASIPNVKSQLLRTGSRIAPVNASAITKCPNASQSVP